MQGLIPILKEWYLRPQMPAPGGLRKAVIAIAAADADIKGAAADPIYALERAIMTVCAARGSR